MDFKKAAKSGQFEWEMPDFINKSDELEANRMAGDYMKEYFKKTEFKPKTQKNAEQNMSTYGVRSPFEQHIQDKQYRQMLQDEKRREKWKAK